MYPHLRQRYFGGKAQPSSGDLDRISCPSQFGHATGVLFPLRMDRRTSLSADTSSQALMKFDAGFGKTAFHENLLHFVSVISLEDNGIVLGSSSAGAVGLEPCRKVLKVNALAINTFDNCCRFAPLPHFHTDFNRLLFHANGAADAEIFW